MLYIFRANVKDGKLRELQQWLKDNRKKIDESQPDSWKLAGLYFPVFGFGPRLFEIHWQVSGYNAFEEASGQYQGVRITTSDPIAKLYSFLDIGSQQGSLLKEVTDDQTVVLAD